MHADAFAETCTCRQHQLKIAFQPAGRGRANHVIALAGRQGGKDGFMEKQETGNTGSNWKQTTRKRAYLPSRCRHGSREPAACRKKPSGLPPGKTCAAAGRPLCGTPLPVRMAAGCRRRHRRGLPAHHFTRAVSGMGLLRAQENPAGNKRVKRWGDIYFSPGELFFPLSGGKPLFTGEP